MISDRADATDIIETQITDQTLLDAPAAANSTHWYCVVKVANIVAVNSTTRHPSLHAAWTSTVGILVLVLVLRKL